MTSQFLGDPDFELLNHFRTFLGHLGSLRFYLRKRLFAFSGIFPSWKKLKSSDELFHLMKPDETLILDLFGPFLPHFSSSILFL